MTKIQATKEKIIQLNFIKMKNFCASKNAMKKMKRQAINWEKIFINLISNQELTYQIYNEIYSIIKRQVAQ